MSRRSLAPDPFQRLLFDEVSADAPAFVIAASASPLNLSIDTEDAPSHVEEGEGGQIFRHPAASREILLQGQRVAYAFKRARRRSIGFVVAVDGLSVHAPKWVRQGDVDRALRDKATWIMRKLQEQSERQRRQQAARVDWCDGARIPFFGEPIVVVLDPRVAGAVLHAEDGSSRLALHLGLPRAAEPAQIRDAVRGWLQRQARRVFEERCKHYAPRLGVRYTKLSLSSAQTRWGSANASGAIRLNWRLIHFALPTIDYVVTHELAHLREMNHSARFWDVVRSVLPDFESARGRLKDDSLPIFD